LLQSNPFQLLGLTLAVVGILTSISQLLTLPSWFLRGPAAAGAIGLINTIVSLAGAVSQPVIGMLREATGGYSLAMAILASGLVLASVLVLALGRAIVPRTSAAKEAPA